LNVFKLNTLYISDNKSYRGAHTNFKWTCRIPTRHRARFIWGN